MPDNPNYLMENPEENLRLEKKTREESVQNQAVWSGIRPGFRVLDAGCGPGKTTSILEQLIQPNGSIVGVDYSKKRIQYAIEKYGHIPDIDFHLHDLRHPLKNMGLFDFIWARFVLEYNRAESFEIVRNLTLNLKPGGCLCLIDLDYNCLSHYEIPDKMETKILKIAEILELEHNFDPYVGRKLFSYLYDLGYEDVEVDVMAHHLFFGRIGENDIFNWQKKMEMATTIGKGLFNDYPGEADGFAEDFRQFLLDPRRFTYTPMILCKGRKPA